MVDVSARIADLSPDKLRLLARRLGKKTETPAPPELISRPDERYQPFPLTDVQQAYWLGRSGLFALGNVSAHGYSEIEAPDLDVPRFERALRRIIDRHPMLRMIVLPDGQQQVLERVEPYRVVTQDLRGLPPAEVDRGIEEVRRQMSHQILPADRWPLFEIRATLLDGQRVRLHISFDILVADLWSYQILMRDLARYYEEPDLELPPLALSFRDYVLTVEAMRETEVYQRSLDYWNRRLPTLPPAPELPLAVSPEAVAQPRFVRRTKHLDPETWTRLRTIAGREGLTPSGVLLTAYAEVLAAWSKSPQLTLNMTLFNRLPLHPEVSEVVGDFTSLNLLAVDSRSGDTFLERARACQEQLWRDLEHSHIGGVRLLRELGRIRGRQVMPVVFTSSLTQDTVESRAGAASLFGEMVYSISQTPQVWLDHQVSERDGAAYLVWDAVEELFPPGMLDDMFAAYGSLLDRLAAGEGWHSRESRLLPAWQDALLAQVNATAAPVPAQTLHGLFAEQARQRPAAPAVVSARRNLTYAELERRSLALARSLRELGAQPGQLVAVAMEKGWEQAVAVLGILESGAAYLPIDPGLPPQRLAHLCRRGEVSLLVTQPWLEERLEWPAGVRRIVVDETEPDFVERPAPLRGGEGLAYVIFTSGSTGDPKGVAIDHRGAVNTVLDVNQRFGVGPEDRVLALSSLSFDLSVYDIFGLLAAGGAVVMLETGAGRNPGRWYEVVRDARVTVWNTVPALMQMLAEYAADKGAPPLPALRLVLLSGDWIPVTLPDQVRGFAPDARVISLGGATEASIWSVLYPIERVEPGWKSIPYGRPMVNQTLHVLDSRLEPRPVWVPGDLYIGGIGVALGYWRDEERTAASFVTHPVTGERLYRTGDLARALAGGALEFLGREDAQVKIQGYRIELGEVESALEEQPGVRNAVALAVGVGNARRLVACVVPEQGGVPGPREEGRAPVPAVAQISGPRSAEKSARIAAGRVPRAALAELLGSVLQMRLQEAPLPKYRYGSAGSLYPVQTYVVIRPDRVEGVEAGAYYFHPRDNRLVRLSAGAAEGLFTWCDAETLERAAFALVLVGSLAAVEPIYGPWGRLFSVLEAGYMGELLRHAALESELALAPAAVADPAEVRRTLVLGEEHLPVHVLLGGARYEGPVRTEAMAAAVAVEAAPASPVLRLEPAPVLHRLLDDPLRQLEHKLSEPGLRKVAPAAGGIALPAPRAGEERTRLYTERRTYREFLSTPVPADHLENLLAQIDDLRAILLPHLGDDALPRLHVYVQIKADRVTGLPAGFYRYDFTASPWVKLGGGGEIDPDVHGAVNRTAFEQAAFSIFVVVDPLSALPEVSPWVLDLSALAAGAIGQRLMETAPPLGLGICPIGTMGFDRIRHRFDLQPADLLVHSFVGGGIAGGDAGRLQAAPEEDRLCVELREVLRQKLPDYMVPAMIFTIGEVPLTANGKVDRAVLAQRLDVSAQEQAAYAPPRTESERRIAAIWQEVLGTAKVGMNDNFFELGGTSVTMVRMHRKLQDLLGREIPLTQLFAHPRPRDLARLLDLEAPASASLEENVERAELRRTARDRRRRPGVDAGTGEGGFDE
jgi:epothilone synthetase B